MFHVSPAVSLWVTFASRLTWCMLLSLDLFHKTLEYLTSWIFFCISVSLGQYLNQSLNTCTEKQELPHISPNISLLLFQPSPKSFPKPFLSPSTAKESRRYPSWSSNASRENYFFTSPFANSPSALFFCCLFCPVALKNCSSENSLLNWRIFRSFSKEIPSNCFCEITIHIHMYIPKNNS